MKEELKRQNARDVYKRQILNTGCQLPIGTPKANVEAFIYAARKYGRGARLGCMPRGITEEA